MRRRRSTRSCRPRRWTKGALLPPFRRQAGAVFRLSTSRSSREVSERVAAAFLEPDPWVDLCAGCQAMLDAHLDPSRAAHSAPGRAGGARRGHNSRRGYAATARSYCAARSGARSALVVIRPLPLKVLALMLTGAILEGCMAIADSEDPTRAREDAGNVLTTLLEGLRPHTLQPARAPAGSPPDSSAPEEARRAVSGSPSSETAAIAAKAASG